jgi:formate/nitrite transporter FocA (FNT family)
VSGTAKEADLDHDEEQQVEEYENVPSSVIFEAIRREGERELSRPFSVLWWSGVGAGLAISRSVLCKGLLASILPHADWAAGISNPATRSDS